MSIEDIFDINTTRRETNYENDENLNEVLDVSFDKNDVNVFFFENKNANNDNDYKINSEEIYW